MAEPTFQNRPLDILGGLSRLEQIKSQRAATGLAESRLEFAQQQAIAEQKRLEEERERRILSAELDRIDKLTQNKEFAKAFPEQFDKAIDRGNQITTKLFGNQSPNLSGKAIRANLDRWTTFNKLDATMIEDFGEGSPEHINFLREALPDFSEEHQKTIEERISGAKESGAQQALSALVGGGISQAEAIRRGVSTEDISRLTKKEPKTPTVTPVDKLFVDKKGNTRFVNLRDPVAVKKAQEDGFQPDRRKDTAEKEEKKLPFKPIFFMAKTATGTPISEVVDQNATDAEERTKALIDRGYLKVDDLTDPSAQFALQEVKPPPVTKVPTPVGVDASTAPIKKEAVPITEVTEEDFVARAAPLNPDIPKEKIRALFRVKHPKGKVSLEDFKVGIELDDNFGNQVIRTWVKLKKKKLLPTLDNVRTNKKLQEQIYKDITTLGGAG